jgi:UDP-GlcNAc:undecaprenyl-phosphate/decaprenyl-phosphate GlcNAc-1-phosphate transferase
MREYGLTVLVAAAVTYLLTPLIRRFAIGVGARHAARDRDVHVEPTALLGGLAMYGGLAAGLLVASRLTHLGTVFHGTRVASGLLLAGAVLVLVGFVDDRWGIGVLPKLAGQVAAGVILVWSGAVVAWLPLPGRGTLSLTADQQTALTILVVVVTINAVNFIDGLDGLAAGIVGIGAAAFFVYYYTLTKRLGLDEQTGPALASAVLAGVCLGFLPHNFNPARIFMGDTGSMLLGLLLAYAPISSLASLDPSTLTTPSAYGGGTVNRFPEVLPLLVPATIMLIPYADLLLAVFRRTRAGLSPFAADKKHLQHRLLAIGHSHRASVLIMYLWATLFAGTVVLLSIMRTKLLVLAMVTVAGVLVLLLASMPRLRWWTRRGSQRLAPAAASPVPSPVPATVGRPPGVPAGPVPGGRLSAGPVPGGRGPAAASPDGAGAAGDWPGQPSGADRPGRPAKPGWPGQSAEPEWPGRPAEPAWPGPPAAHPWPPAPAHRPQPAPPADGDDTQSPLAPWRSR